MMSALSPGEEYLAARAMGNTRLVAEETVVTALASYTLIVYHSWYGDENDPAERVEERVAVVSNAKDWGGADLIGGTVRASDRSAYEAKYPSPPPRPEPVVTAEMPRVSAFKCGDCEALYTEPGDPCWECSRCGQIEASEDRRCGECNIFRAKIAPGSCPDCGAAHGDVGDEYQPETVLAVDTAERGLVEVPA